MTPEIRAAIRLLEDNQYVVLTPRSQWLDDLGRKAVDGDEDARRRYLEAIGERLRTDVADPDE